MTVFSVPASRPLLHEVARALIDGRLVDGFTARDDPARLADVTLYLPTRRAGRLARAAFLDVVGGDVVLLPRIVALGDVDEDELVFADEARGAAPLSLPPAIGALERRLLLAELILRWAAQPGVNPPEGAPLVVTGTAAALRLADDLAGLIDDMTTRGVAWDALDQLVPDDFDRYWQLTLRFLGIARTAWPALLAARGAIDAAQRRDLLLAAEAERLASARGPVVAAGSTGSMPATARFLAAIARLPHGAVVLPGLDRHLDDTAWAMIAAAPAGDGTSATPLYSHPQFAMRSLLDTMRLTRADVRDLVAPRDGGRREALMTETMRPAPATACWHDRLAAAGDEAMAGLSIITAAHAEEEALAVAIALREADAHGTTAALVTPDRALARRVIAALARWNVAVDDSGGDALSETPAGLFARLVAVVACEGAAPAALLALLKHPLLRLGGGAGDRADAIATLELALLRGLRPAPGSAGLRHALARFADDHARFHRGDVSGLHRSEPRAHLDAAAIVAAQDLVDRLTAALAPLEQLAARGSFPLGEGLAAHRAALIALAGRGDGMVDAFAGSDGNALADLFDAALAAAADGGLAVEAAGYAETFTALAQGHVVRRAETRGARLRIYGPLEARLTSAETVILAGLNEGSWPPEVTTDAWLNRAMRRALGLDLPERRIGLSAHDFTQLASQTRVILSRAAKTGGAPTVAARFLLRLEAVAGADAWAAACERGAPYLRWARAVDEPDRYAPAKPPAPTPPLAARPTRLSVSDISDWLRDPYTIYARRILRLAVLNPVDTPLSPRDRGLAVHGALGDFTQAFAGGLPADAETALIACAETRFAPLGDHAAARALWWPRFTRIARWFIDTLERERRGNAAMLYGEISGEIALPMGSQTFRLSTRADRIERLRDGRFVILDYKTGQTPSTSQVRSGLAPQLLLEAAILRAGGFAGIPADASVADLIYVRVSGAEPAGEVRSVTRGKTPLLPDVAATEALEKLAALVAAFADETQPYRALVMPMWRGRHGDYDHLARVREWSATGGDGDGDEAGGDAGGDA